MDRSPELGDRRSPPPVHRGRGTTCDDAAGTRTRTQVPDGWEATAADLGVARIHDAGPGPLARELNDDLADPERDRAPKVGGRLTDLVARVPAQEVARLVTEMEHDRDADPPRFPLARIADTVVAIRSPQARDAVFWRLAPELRRDLLAELVERREGPNGPDGTPVARGDRPSAQLSLQVAVELLRREGRERRVRGPIHDLARAGRLPAPPQQEAALLAALDDRTAATVVETWWAEELGQRSRQWAWDASDRIQRAAAPRSPDGSPLRGPDRLLALLPEARRDAVLEKCRSRLGAELGPQRDSVEARSEHTARRDPGERTQVTRLLRLGPAAAARALTTPLLGPQTEHELKTLAMHLAAALPHDVLRESIGPDHWTAGSPHWLRDEAIRRAGALSGEEIRARLAHNLSDHAGSALRLLRSLAARNHRYAAKVVTRMDTGLAVQILRGDRLGEERLSERDAAAILDAMPLRRSAELAALLHRDSGKRWAALQQELARRDPGRAARIDNRKHVFLDDPATDGRQFFAARARQYFLGGWRTRARTAIAYTIVSVAALPGSAASTVATGGSLEIWLRAVAPMSMLSQLVGGLTVHGLWEPRANRIVLPGAVPGFGGTRLGDSPQGRMITVNTGWGGQNFGFNSVAALIVDV